MWHCLIIDHDPECAGDIASTFQDHGHTVATCHDGTEGLRLATQEAWDVIILDRMLTDNVDGLSILAALRDSGKHTPVLMLSAQAATHERVEGLKAGADDYLGKPFDSSELSARIEALVRRTRMMSVSPELTVGNLTLDLLTRTATRAGHEITLQPREFRLLAFFMMHADRLVTRTMLLESVWEYNFDPQTNVIDVQVSRLRTKIDAGHTVRLIHTVRGSGYIFSSSGAIPVLANP